MATTNFIDNETPVVAAWLNDVDEVAYTDVPALEAKTANLPTVSAYAGTLMDDVDAAAARTTLGAAASGANTDISSLSGVTSINGGPLGGLRNRVINGNFGVNQRAVSGSVVLAAGAYGHDRWKAGASGCTYTFATSANVTTLTISAGSLQQVIEDANLESGTYALSWTGTATGKIGAGSYAASGVTGAVTGGTNTTIEFSTGTVSKVQFEIGTATTFEQRPYGMELALCQRYYEKGGGGGDSLGYSFYTNSAQAVYAPVFYKATKRAAPTLSLTLGSSAYISDFAVNSAQAEGSSVVATSNGAGNGFFFFSWTAAIEL